MAHIYTNPFDLTETIDVYKSFEEQLQKLEELKKQFDKICNSLINSKNEHINNLEKQQQIKEKNNVS